MTFKSVQSMNTMNQIQETQETQDPDANALLDAYYKQLTPFERQTCDIARDHLGSSFDLARSNGFLCWLAKKR
jgi:hypothetical protein